MEADKKVRARRLGIQGEKTAVDYLRKKKYSIIARAFRLYRGEIDIIAVDGKTLVFVEVKTRSAEDFGRAEEAVTPAKQDQIRRIAQGFLDKKHLGDVACRFDVLALVGTEKDGFTVRHFKDAF
ncbi:MAG: YraN family protein [Acidobacteriota bacterium]|nr:YraN family protein [Acidobacteriota bacterium]